MPDDVMYFVALGGGAAVEGDFQKTTLGKLWNDPGTQSFVNSVKTTVLTKIAEEAGEDEASAMIALATGYARLVLDRPLVMGIAGAEAEEGPPACVFAILDAGPRKADLADALTQVENMLGEDEICDTQVGSLAMHGLEDNDDVPLYWGWVGNYLVFAVNDAKGAVTTHLTTPRSAATGYLNKVPGKGDLLAVYYDVGKILSIVNVVAESEGGEEDFAPIKAALEELGLNSLGAIVARVGFSGSQMVSDTFVAAPAPRKGLLAAFQPVDPAVLGMVDAQAVTASAFNCDVAGIYDTVMKAIKAASPDEGYPEIQEGLAEFESEAGFSIRNGLLKSLGGPVVFYTLPAGQMVEAPMGGIVVNLKLNDAALFEKTMKGLGDFIAKMAEGMLQVGEQKADDGRTIHVWASPPLAFAQVMPTWAIVDNQVIIGSNTALCKMGIDRASGDASGKSLRDAAGFKKIAANLPKNLLSLTYTDSQVMFNQMMMQLQQFWPMANMAAAQAKIKLPMMLPQLGHIAQELQPACEYTYLSPDGFHSHYQGSGLEVSLRGIAGGAFGAGFALPALARARSQARSAVAMSHLKQIGLAVILYAEDHDGKLPEKLDDVRKTYLDGQLLKSPRKPTDFDGPSYLYVSGHSMGKDDAWENVVAYENPEFCDDRITVVFLDGHVEAMTRERFREKLQATYERLGREMPEINF